MESQRHIIHVDMDAFYASVEQLDNPELRGKPVIVGGTGPRGVVAAASYEVREYGVRSAMPARRAMTLCPDAICVRPRMSRYREVSREIFGIFRDFTPMVEGLSLDEAFLDITASCTIYGTPARIGQLIKQRIFEETGLTASVGIGPNKLVAKIASDLEKPDGLCELTEENLRETFDPLPVERLMGVGPRTAESLHVQKIYTFKDLRTAEDARLKAVFGRYSERVRQRASGIDDRPVGEHAKDKSISTEETFDTDITDHAEMKTQVLHMAEAVASRLRKKQWVADQVSVKIRRADFTTYSRQKSFRPATDSTREVQELATRLLDNWLGEQPDAAIRLLGVGVGGLQPAQQIGLFDKDGGVQDVDDAVDTVRRRFGDDALQSGADLGRKGRRH